MKKLILIIAAILSSINLLAQTYSGGTGTAENPYQISTLGDLRYLSENGEADWDKHFIMTNDIDASDTKNWNDGAGFLPIGKDENSPFVGTFDGGGFAIDSLYIRVTDEYADTLEYVGFFGYSNGEIENMNIQCNILIDYCYLVIGVGVLVGNNHGTINNCFIHGSIENENYNFPVGSVGIVTGKNYGNINNSYGEGLIYNNNGIYYNQGLLTGVNIGSIESSSVEGTIEDYGARWSYGIFIGRNEGIIIKCFAIGTLLTDYTPDLSFFSCGGFVGVNSGSIEQSFCMPKMKFQDMGLSEISIAGFVGTNSGEISNCYSIFDMNFSGWVSSIELTIGGFVAINKIEDDKIGTINNSYVTGTYTETTKHNTEFPGGGAHFILGGFCTENHENCIINTCFWNEELIDITENTGGTAKSTSQMQDINTFLDADWDFENIWTINDTINDGYPYLQEKSVGIVETEQITSSILIYPNPATTIIHITSKDIINSVEIYNITGQLLLTSDSKQINVSNLTNGIYQLVLRSGKQIDTEQLIIMR